MSGVDADVPSGAADGLLSPSPISRHPSTDSERRRTGEAAMHRAASAMIEATETFRRQFRDQQDMPRDQHGPSYHLVEGGGMIGGDVADGLRVPDSAHALPNRSYDAETVTPGSMSPPSTVRGKARLSMQAIPVVASPPRPASSEYHDDRLPSEMGSPPNLRRATIHPDSSVYSAANLRRPQHAPNRASMPLPFDHTSSNNKIPRKPVPSEAHLSLLAPPPWGPALAHQQPQPPGSPPPPHVIEFARAVSQFMVQSTSYNNNQYFGRESYYSHMSNNGMGMGMGGMDMGMGPPPPPGDLHGEMFPGDPPLKPPPAPQAPARPNMSLGREILFVLMICLAQVLMLAGIAQAMVPCFEIADTFPGTTMGDLAWFSAAYGLTAGTFVLPSGRLGDVFGHKRIFIIGFLWFGLWSLMAGLSTIIQDGGGNGIIYFCTCRGLQGLGPAMLVPNGQALLGRNYAPGPRRNMVMCLFGAAAPLGFVLGAVFSSLFAMNGMWSWAFYVLAAVCVALAALSTVILPATVLAPRPPGVSMWNRLDVTGIFVGVSGLVIFNVAWNQVPIATFSEPYTYFMIIIGVILIAGFVYVETMVPYPILPVSAMTSNVNFVLACTATGWGCFSIWIWYLVQFLMKLRHWSPLGVSAALAPAPLTGLAASLLVGILMKNKVKPQWIMLIAMVSFTLGSILIATAPVDQIYWANTFVAIFIMPFGMDMSNPAATILVSESVSREHQGIAASLVVTGVNYAISVSLGMAGTVERYVIDANPDPEGNLLAAYRGAQYFGVGVGGLGVLISLVFLVRSYCVTARPSKGKYAAVAPNTH